MKTRTAFVTKTGGDEFFTVTDLRQASDPHVPAMVHSYSWEDRTLKVGPSKAQCEMWSVYAVAWLMVCPDGTQLAKETSVLSHVVAWAG